MKITLWSWMRYDLFTRELREALLDENIKLVAIRKALASRGFEISQGHLSTYRSELRNGIR